MAFQTGTSNNTFCYLLAVPGVSLRGHSLGVLVHPTYEQRHDYCHQESKSSHFTFDFPLPLVAGNGLGPSMLKV